MRQAQDKLELLRQWLDNEFTKEFLGHLKQTALDSLGTVTRAPKSIEDFFVLEQDKGFIKGVLEPQKVIDQHKEDLEAEAAGDFVEPETEKPETPLDVMSALKEFEMQNVL